MRCVKVNLTAQESKWLRNQIVFNGILVTNRSWWAFFFARFNLFICATSWLLKKLLKLFDEEWWGMDVSQVISIPMSIR